MLIKIFNKLKNFLIYFLKIIYYISDLFYYKRKINKEIKQQYPLKLMPVIEVNNQSGIVSKHYFFQDLWAAKKRTRVGGSKFRVSKGDFTYIYESEIDEIG